MHRRLEKKRAFRKKCSLLVFRRRSVRHGGDCLKQQTLRRQIAAASIVCCIRLAHLLLVSGAACPFSVEDIGICGSFLVSGRSTAVGAAAARRQCIAYDDVPPFRTGIPQRNGTTFRSAQSMRGTMWAATAAGERLGRWDPFSLLILQCRARSFRARFCFFSIAVSSAVWYDLRINYHQCSE